MFPIILLVSLMTNLTHGFDPAEILTPEIMDMVVLAAEGSVLVYSSSDAVEFVARHPIEGAAGVYVKGIFYCFFVERTV
jgi:hypothetical protein